MILCTVTPNMEDKIKYRLEKNEISYIVQKLGNGNANIFFGKEECLTVVKKICKGKNLNELSPEEDFMLGIMLGYSVSEQCRRYCKKNKEISTILSL